MRAIRDRALIIGLLLIALLFRADQSSAQKENGEFFAQTGHWVTGDFLKFYKSVPDHIKLYGYPITDSFPKTVNGTKTMLVQYFERARFELNTDNPPDLRVVLSPLGFLLYDNNDTPYLSMPPNFPACRQFPETDHQVCYAFLDFFNANGGIVQFGYPISEVELRDGLMVQYFQRARFEWHPEFPSGQRVILTDLGRIYFQKHEDQSQSRPLRDGIPNTIMALRARAFTEKAVLSNGGTQTIYVVVQDQILRPISYSQVTFTIKLPSGEEERYIMPLTDKNGITSLPLRLIRQPPGIVEIVVTAIYEEYQARTRTSFHIWW